MTTIFIKIPKSKPYTDNAVAPPQLYEGGELYEFDDQVPAELAAAQRIIAARAGYDISNLVAQANPVLVGAGSVTAPAIAAASDTGTGVFFPSAGSLAVALAGALALTFAPDATATFEGDVILGATQKLGIGTTPTVDIDVLTSGNAAMKFKSTFAGGTAQVTFDTSGNGSVGRLAFAKDGVSAGGVGYTHGTGTDQSLGFNVAGGSDKMTLYGNTRLALGYYSAPEATLHAGGGAIFETSTPILTLRATSATSTSRLYFGDPAADLRGALFYAHSDDSLALWTAGAVAVTIASNKKVTLEGGLNAANLPTSATGLDPGDIWKDGSGFLRAA